jgi:hypothetical protein
MAKAFPTDNPFLQGYYGPVNTEADAATCTSPARCRRIC